MLRTLTIEPVRLIANFLFSFPHFLPAFKSFPRPAQTVMTEPYVVAGTGRPRSAVQPESARPQAGDLSVLQAGSQMPSCSRDISRGILLSGGHAEGA